MNTEKLIKLQNFIRENDIEDDELVEEIMDIDVDDPDIQKGYLDYWKSINGKFFKKKLNEYIELTHILSVEVLLNNTVRVTVDRYAFNANSKNITLYSSESLPFVTNVDKNRYDSHTEITKEEYDDIVCKLKDLTENIKLYFSQL